MPIQKRCATGVIASSEKRDWKRNILNLLIHHFAPAKARYLSGNQVLPKRRPHIRLQSTAMVSIIIITVTLSRVVPSIHSDSPAWQSVSLPIWEKKNAQV